MLPVPFRFLCLPLRRSPQKLRAFRLPRRRRNAASAAGACLDGINYSRKRKIRRGFLEEIYGESKDLS
jgi:hypothetical protein